VLGGTCEATGRVRINGEEMALTGRHADGRTRRGQGIAHVPEDRQRAGLVMPFAAWENAVFGYHRDPAYNRGVLMDNEAIRRDADNKIERFDIRPANCRLSARSFSGGNQQKIVLAREIDRNPDLLLVGQPTRGVDIGAIEFIHQEIVRLRDAGKAILLVSVELDEIFSLADRIVVMFDGRVMGERDPARTDERELGLLMAGIEGEPDKPEWQAIDEQWERVEAEEEAARHG
jgi:simple sugar transport system ATP-binding protein